MCNMHVVTVILFVRVYSKYFKRSSIPFSISLTFRIAKFCSKMSISNTKFASTKISTCLTNFLMCLKDRVFEKF